MLYMITARFKPGVEERHAALAGEFVQHVRQPLLRIRLVGAITDEAGRKVGVLTMMEADDRAKIDHFLALSPYVREGLYESVQVELLQIETGGLK
jgi:uncharacterized protein YciI